MIRVRPPESIYQAHGTIQDGTFTGRWHFSFDEYADPEYVHFGPLRVFNDDTLSPGAVWPLHPHRNIEVVTYCAAGEFLHADEHGQGSILKKGWVQHTTVGRGMKRTWSRRCSKKPWNGPNAPTGSCLWSPTPTPGPYPFTPRLRYFPVWRNPATS
jgi:hypothetical protein